MYGKVKTVKADRGFGFLKCEDGRSVFFHVKDCEPEITAVFDDSLVGRRLEFNVVNGDKGLKATDVRDAA